MKHVPVLTLALTFAVSGVASPQALRVTAMGVVLSHQDTQGGSDAKGTGFGGQVDLRLGRFGIEGTAFRASATATQTIGLNSGQTSDVTLTQIDVRARLALARAFALEAGAGRRSFKPEFSSQDVGVVRVGIVSEMPLTQSARVWGRVAYLPVAKFNGGGTASLGLETGFGGEVSFASGHWHLSFNYLFQRIDRELNGAKVPLQLSVASLGLGFGI
jgi:hypothetical protein